MQTGLGFGLQKAGMGGRGPTGPAPVIWPDASNTGPRIARTVYPGNYTVQNHGETVSGLSFASGSINVNGKNNVIIEDCEFVTTPGNAASAIINNITPGTNLTVRYCRMDGYFLGIYSKGNFHHNDILHAENGIVIPNVISADPTVIYFNWIHDFAGAVDAHFDGIECNGNNSNVTIQHNRINNQQPNTSCIMINNIDGPSNGFLIDDNWVNGGSYCIYVSEQFQVADISNVVITNNLVTPLNPQTSFNISGGGVTSIYGNYDPVTGEYPGGQSPRNLLGTAVFTPSSQTIITDSNANISFRMVATLAADITGPFRIAIQSPLITRDSIATNVSVGKSNGTASQTTATPVEVKFGSALNSGFDMTLGEYILSAPIPLSAIGGAPVAAGQKLVVIIDTPAIPAGDGQALTSGNTNVTAYFKAAAQTYNDPNPAGMTLSANNNFGLMAIVV